MVEQHFTEGCGCGCTIHAFLIAMVTESVVLLHLKPVSSSQGNYLRNEK